MKKTLFLFALLSLFISFSFCEQLEQGLPLDIVLDATLDETIQYEPVVHLPTGRHVIADLWGCQLCHYTDDIEDVMRQAAQKASATVLDITIEKFPAIEVNGQMVQGMTGTVILSESHIAFHTWPEAGFVACDIFTCGTNALPEKGLEVLIGHFKPENENVRILGRGKAAEGSKIID